MNAALLSDIELAARIREGNEPAFTQFYHALYSSFFYFTNKLIADTEMARSIVLSSFEKLWQRRDRFAGITDMRAFMYTTCRNHAYDILRQKSGRKGSAELLAANPEELATGNNFEDTAETAMIRTELYRQLYEEINRLTPAQKTIMGLLLEGKTYQEIAIELKLSPEAIRKTRFLAVARLRRQMKDKKMLSLLLLHL